MTAKADAQSRRSASSSRRHACGHASVKLGGRRLVALLTFCCTVAWLGGTVYVLLGTRAGVPSHAQALVGTCATLALLGVAFRAVGADKFARLFVAMIAPMATVASVTGVVIATHRMGLTPILMYGFVCIGTILAILTAGIRRHADNAGQELSRWISDFFIKDVAGLPPDDFDEGSDDLPSTAESSA